MKTTTLIVLASVLFYSCSNEKDHVNTENVSDNLIERGFEGDSIDAANHNNQVTEADYYDEELEDTVHIEIRSELYEYLVQNYDSTSNGKYQSGDSPYGDKHLCFFEQNFSEQIEFRKEACQDGGGTEYVIFPMKSKEVLYKIVNEHLSTEGNFWNEDSTSYEPEEGAGCFYNIETKKDTSFLSVYCGC